MRTVLGDLNYAARTFLRSPVFTLVAILTLALGIGLNTAVFSVVHAVLLEQLPFPEPDRLVTIWEHGKRSDRNVVSPANFLDWKAQNHVFAEMSAITDTLFTLRGVGDPENIPGQNVSINIFPMLGLPPDRPCSASCCPPSCSAAAIPRSGSRCCSESWPRTC